MERILRNLGSLAAKNTGRKTVERVITLVKNLESLVVSGATSGRLTNSHKLLQMHLKRSFSKTGLINGLMR